MRVNAGNRHHGRRRPRRRNKRKTGWPGLHCAGGRQEAGSSRTKIPRRPRPGAHVCIATGARHDPTEADLASDSRMRLFVAIDLTAEIRERTIEYIARLLREVPGAAAEKWVRAESLHLTLKFIGQSDSVDDIKEALRQVQSASFQISICNVGFFTPQNPRIFWAGVKAPSELQD